MGYEYRVIAAPKKLKRRKGVSSATELFATTLAECINAEAQDGWEYLRTETLSAEEPGGWFRRAAVVEETMMIFRRRRLPVSAETGEVREVEAQRRQALLARRGPVAQERPRQEQGPAEARPHPARPAEAAPPLLRPVPRGGHDKK